MWEGEVTPAALARCLSARDPHSLALSVEHKHSIPFYQGTKQRLASVFDMVPNLCIRKEMTEHPHLSLKLHPSVRSLLEATGKTILVYPNRSGIMTVPTWWVRVPTFQMNVEGLGVTGGDVWDKMHFQRKHSTSCPVALTFPSCWGRSEECVVWSHSDCHLCWPTAPSHKIAVLVHWENECDYAGHDARHTVETQNTAGGSDFVSFPSKWSFITWDLFIFLFF